MKIKRVFFWAHLCSAVAAATFILIMSVTGVMLAYEHQLVARAEQRNHVAAAPEAAPLSAERLAGFARQAAPQAAGATLRFAAEATAPVTVQLGREGTLLLDPYTGALIDDAAAGTRDFLRLMENWHRTLDSASRDTGRAITGASNLVFLFLVLSGIYLWLPDAWLWPAFRFRMLFDPKPVNGKMRDFNWHHVFAFWTGIPLFLIVISGVVMSYDWANRLVYAAYGEPVPQRRGPPGQEAPPPRAARAQGDPGAGAAVADAPRASLDALLATAKSTVPDWQTITLPLAARGDSVSVTVERRSTAARPPRQNLRLSVTDATVLSDGATQSGPQSTSPGQRLRTWFRFVHTGEEYGLVGQTIAALASLAACFLVYTGLALAYRRLIRPLFQSR